MNSETNIKKGAGFIIRALSKIIDLIYILLLFAVALVFTMLSIFLFKKLNLINNEFPIGFSSQFKHEFFNTFFFMAILVYATIADFFHSASPGKLICKLHVLDVSGKKCTFKGSIIRNITLTVESLFFGLIALLVMNYSEVNQRLGDLLGKTFVLKESDLPDDYIRSKKDIITGIVISSLVFVFLISAFYFFECYMFMLSGAAL